MDRFTGRRKLIRGSLSAPLVLTVASPGALARTSFGACLTRTQVPDNLALFAEQQDGFLRTAVQVYSGKLKGQEASQGKQLFYKVSDSYYKLADCSEAYTATDFTGRDSPKADGVRYALVYVDEHGRIVQWGGACPPSNGSPVTVSCWASFGG